MDIIDRPYASTGMIDQLKAAADMTKEVSDTEVYFGFCQPGTTATSEPYWSIMKITSSGTSQPITTSFKWANGTCAYNLIWDNYESYTYLFKKF